MNSKPPAEETEAEHQEKLAAMQTEHERRLRADAEKMKREHDTITKDMNEAHSREVMHRRREAEQIAREEAENDAAQNAAQIKRNRE